MDSNIPLVSICCATYNHEDYIRTAIEGFLAQQTTFPIEIIIHDDASIDKTPEILKEYADKYPDLINLILQTENQYSKGIKVLPTFIYPRAHGKYIAMCEGDDYWTDPLKLQKQVDFLEKNPDYSLCFHNFYRLMDGKLKLANLFTGDTINFEEYASHLYGIQTLTIVIRNILTPVLEQKVNLKIRGSKFLFLRMAEYGKMKNLNEPMAVYRVHAGGIWSGTSRINQSMMALENIEAMILYYEKNHKIKEILKKTYCETSIHYVLSHIKNHEYSDAIKVIFMSIYCGTKIYNPIFIPYYLFKLLKKK